MRINDTTSHLTHQDPNDLGFLLKLMVHKITLRIWNSTDDYHNNIKENLKEQWVIANTENVSFNLYKYVFDIKLQFEIGDIKISETKEIKDDILIHQGGSPIELKIDIMSMYSPNLGDSEIIVKINFCHLLILYEPNCLNKVVKFFRNVKTSIYKDLEKLLL